MFLLEKRMNKNVFWAGNAIDWLLYINAVQRWEKEKLKIIRYNTKHEENIFKI